MAYPDTDVIILCFSVVRQDSFDNIYSKWITEINKYIPTAKIVLVGTQVDLRSDLFLRNSYNIFNICKYLLIFRENNRTNVQNTNDPSRTYSIQTKDGEDMKHRIKAYKYIECSALTQFNIAQVFNTCVEAVNHKEKPSCFHSMFKRLTFTKCMGKKSPKTYKYTINGCHES